MFIHRHSGRQMMIGLIAFVFILAVPQSALALDTQPSSQRMVEVGLVESDHDDDLRLDQTITRAELIAILVKAFNHEDEAIEQNDAPPAFEDMTDHPWANGYVTVAKALLEDKEQVLGRDDDTFDPDGSLTAAETVAFLMKFLDIEPAEALSWPDNYMKGAVQAGMLPEATVQELSAYMSEPITRGIAFYIADQAFQAPLLEDGKSVYALYEGIASADPAQTTETTDAMSAAVTEPTFSEEVQAALAGLGSMTPPSTEDIHVVFDPYGGPPKITLLYPSEEIEKVLVLDAAEEGNLIGKASEIELWTDDDGQEPIPYFSAVIADGFPNSLKSVYVIVVDAEGNSAMVEKEI